jgi:hypothetical protein
MSIPEDLTHLRVKQKLINLLPNDLNCLSYVYASGIKVYTYWHKISSRVLYVVVSEWLDSSDVT